MMVCHASLSGVSGRFIGITGNSGGSTGGGGSSFDTFLFCTMGSGILVAFSD